MKKWKPRRRDVTKQLDCMSSISLSFLLEILRLGEKNANIISLQEAIKLRILCIQNVFHICKATIFFFKSLLFSQVMRGIEGYNYTSIVTMFVNLFWSHASFHTCQIQFHSFQMHLKKARIALLQHAKQMNQSQIRFWREKKKCAIYLFHALNAQNTFNAL